jgi:hypothetical protein
MALRFMPVDSKTKYLSIVHLGLAQHAYQLDIAIELKARASTLAKEHACNALIVNTLSLPDFANSFYQEHGYRIENGELIKLIK